MTPPAAQRSWRFVHPDLGGGGLQLAPTGAIQMIEADAAIRQAIMLLLATAPGERVRRPEYGCRLRQLAFWPNDETTAGLAIHYVRQALTRWEPRVEILRVDAGPRPGAPAHLEVALDYRIRASGIEDSLSFSFDLAATDR